MPPVSVRRRLPGVTILEVLIVLAIIALLASVVAPRVLGYLGRLIDILSGGTPAQVWAASGAEFILVAVLILTLRLAVHMLQIMLLNNTILPNFGTLVRWRAPRHVLRQSVGWFENDFAGRIAQKQMQCARAVTDIVAESIEMPIPIDQFGCAIACSGVATAICSRVFSRNGPPDAVRISRSTAPRSALSRT